MGAFWDEEQNNHAVKVVALNFDFTVLRALKTLVKTLSEIGQDMGFPLIVFG